jgi:hypothetical protein
VNSRHSNRATTPGMITMLVAILFMNPEDFPVEMIPAIGNED